MAIVDAGAARSPHLHHKWLRLLKRKVLVCCANPLPGKWAGGCAVLGLILSACATSSPPGLKAGADAVLRDPTQQTLAELAANLKHPRLQPMALDFSRPLTPIEVAVIAVVASPDLQALRAKAGVSDAQVFNVGLLPDPVINYAYSKRLAGPDPFDGMSGAVVYELMALRQRRTVLEEQRAADAQVHLDIAWQELQTAGQAELLAHRIVGLRQVLAFDTRTQALAQAALDRALTAEARGDVIANEVDIRRIADADAASAARATEIQLAAAQEGLNKLMGLAPQIRVILASTPPIGLSLRADAQSLFEQAQVQRLDLQALQAGYRSQSAAVRKAMMDAFPTLQLTLGGGEDTAHTQTFDPAVNFTLPLWNRNRGGIAIAKATSAQLRAEYAARVFATRAEINSLVTELALEARQRAEVSAQVAPLRPLIAASQAALGRHDITIDTAEATAQTLADKEVVIAGLDQAMAEQRVTLKLAVGAALID